MVAITGPSVHLAIAVVIVMLGVISSATAGYVGHYGDHDHYAYPKYAYKYGVQDKHTGDFKTAFEERDGAITRGYYSVLQPDGVVRHVKYIVSPKGGFQAEVINSGLGAHPHSKFYH